METIPTINQVREAAGISRSYASMILSDARKPPRALAICIFRSTGWKHPSIADLTDDQIAVLETVEPYRPAQSAA